MSVNRFSIGSDNGLSPIQRQAIIQTNAGFLSIRPLGTNLYDILIKIQKFSFTKMHLKVSSARWRPFCHRGDELTSRITSLTPCYLIPCVFGACKCFTKNNQPFVMKTSSNGSIFCVTGRLCGEFTSRRWIPLTRPVTWSFDVSLICTWISGWVNNCEASDLRCHHTHYDVTTMVAQRPYIAI